MSTLMDIPKDIWQKILLSFDAVVPYTYNDLGGTIELLNEYYPRCFIDIYFKMQTINRKPLKLNCFHEKSPKILEEINKTDLFEELSKFENVIICGDFVTQLWLEKEPDADGDIVIYIMGECITDYANVVKRRQCDSANQYLNINDFTEFVEKKYEFIKCDQECDQEFARFYWKNYKVIVFCPVTESVIEIMKDQYFSFEHCCIRKGKLYALPDAKISLEQKMCIGTTEKPPNTQKTRTANKYCTDILNYMRIVNNISERKYFSSLKYEIYNYKNYQKSFRYFPIRYGISYYKRYLRINIMDIPDPEYLVQLCSCDLYFYISFEVESDNNDYYCAAIVSKEEMEPFLHFVKLQKLNVDIEPNEEGNYLIYQRSAVEIFSKTRVNFAVTFDHNGKDIYLDINRDNEYHNCYFYLS